MSEQQSFSKVPQFRNTTEWLLQRQRSAAILDKIVEDWASTR